jgi:hypothetical protein
VKNGMITTSMFKGRSKDARPEVGNGAGPENALRPMVRNGSMGRHVLLTVCWIGLELEAKWEEEEKARNDVQGNFDMVGEVSR